MVLLVSIAFLLVFVYSIVIILLWRGLGRLSRNIDHGQGNLVPVTVIVPYRNEMERLPDLVGDLTHQTYPADHVEIIFVNDHSEDGSKAMLTSLVSANTRFICLDLPKDKSGKKDAIAYAVQHTGSDWIIQTDADCRLGPHFIRSHMAFREKHHADLVAGLVTTRNTEGGFLEVFERLDLLSLVGTGAGSFYYNRPVMCNGANLAYSRNLYLETREFDPVGKVESGDDMFLMIGARKLGRTLAYNATREAMVETIPVSNLSKLITQRIRWGSKTVHYKTTDIQSLAMLAVIANLLILLIPLFLFLDSGLWPVLLVAYTAKTVTDFALLYRVTGYTGQRKSLRAFFPVSLTYYAVQLVILTKSLFVRSGWKGRSG